MKLSRRQGRILALQALFAWEISKTPIDELLQFEWLKKSERKKLADVDLLFPRLLISGTIENIKMIDEKITYFLRGWEFSRINNVDKAILRFSFYSLLFQNDIPPAIVIDEAVSIAHDYGDDASFSFINAVLDNLHQEISG